MVAKPDLTVIFVTFLAFTTAALAEQSGPATIDLQKTCRVTEKAVAAVFGDAIANVYDRCVENETAARQNS
jgi:lipoprotein signal peptidase